MGSISSPLIRDGHQRGLTSKGTGGHQKGRASKGSGMNSSFGPQKGRASIGTDIKRDWHQWGRASKGTADINWDGHQSGLASNGPPWHQSGRASMRSASIGPASIGWHQTGVVLPDNLCKLTTTIGPEMLILLQICRLPFFLWTTVSKMYSKRVISNFITGFVSLCYIGVKDRLVVPLRHFLRVLPLIHTLLSL